MIKLNSNKYLLIFLLFAAITALILAYISQFIFDYQPCILCLYQRQPFFAVIASALLGLVFFKSEKSQKIALFFCLIFLLINCAIAFYHVGVEQKIFAGPSTCSSSNLDQIDNLEDLKTALLKTKAVRCDQPSFIFLGLSMAAWNFLYCLGLILVSAVLRWKFLAAPSSGKRR
jgi:disulfide bond formation protein DsbB